MRIPSSVFAVGRYALGLAVVAASALMMSGQNRPAFNAHQLVGGQNRSIFDAHDKAAYAPEAMIQYVNPGLVFSVVSAKIAADGTISVDYKTTDPKGLALDTAGIQTPGTISSSFIAAYIPKGQAEYMSYSTRVSTAVTGGATATQASADSGGTTSTVAVGEYIYTFKTKAPTGFDPTASNRIGIYGSRNLTQWDLGTNYASVTFDFVPGGGTPAPRDIVRTPDCNACHYQLAFHGGSRRGVDLCIMCHTTQTTDPNTGNTLDMPVMTHAIHIGNSFPTIESTKLYSIVGFGNAVSSWPTVVYPPDVRMCKTCHNPSNGAAQTNAWLTTPTRAACGACHSNVNFVTGLNHANQVELDDKQCAQCHVPQGELEFDASIIGGHTIPTYSTTLQGIVVTLTKVVGVAGQKPVLSFTVKNNAGAGIPMSQFASGGSLSLSMTGSTSDYGSVSFGSDTTSTPGYVTESAAGSTCDGSGNCTYTFTHAIPAKATGTYAIGVEARLPATLQAGTTVQQSTTYSAHNKVIYFSVDGSAVAARRTVVAEANCNKCHSDLEVHGGLRNDVQYCPVCHNPSNTDFTTRPTATVAADAALPPQAINFALMVHKIHSGVNMAAYNATYIIVGHGGSHNDFSGVLYPAMTPTGAVSDTANCEMCHAAGTENVLPVGKLAVTDPQGLLNPAPATTSACTSCHLDVPSFAHAQSNSDPKFGESCAVCHGASGDFSASQVHAGL
jgi:OmcA/MtrC family decaheme c-type cytochrome